jgi:hypothetical protein
VVKDETVLDSLQGLPQPRGHHYDFAHVALADAARSNPEGFLADVRESGAEGLVVEIWRKCRDKFPSSEDRVDGTGLAAVARDLPCGRGCALVVLPKAERMGEAHMIAAVLIPAERLLGIFKKPAEVRFFTMEVSFDAEKQETTALFEWVYAKGGGRAHNKLATGVAVDEAAFLAAVDERVSA